MCGSHCLYIFVHCCLYIFSSNFLTTFRLFISSQFGKVFMATDKSNNELKAVKKTKRNLVIEECHDILREINNCRTLNHENIISFERYFCTNRPKSTRKDIYLVFELAREDLQQYIDRKVFDITESDIATVSNMLLKGLEYMHKNGFIHRDLKPHNALISMKVNPPF